MVKTLLKAKLPPESEMSGSLKFTPPRDVSGNP